VSRTYPVAESGLSGKSYEEKLVELGLDTLEERRHQADMAMVHKILHGKGQLDHIYIGLRMPWMAKGPPGMQLTPPPPLNLKVTHDRLEVGRNFFSARVIEGWNRLYQHL
jgi:hypothetical protein